MWTKDQLVERFESLPGYRACRISRRDLNHFRCLCHANAIFLGTGCAQSVDPVEAFQTADGEVLEICNPLQECFVAFVR